MKKKSLVVLALVVVLALSFALVACNDKPVEQPLVAPKADTISVDFAKDMTLASVAVPQGYSWKDATTKVKIGTFDYDAEYTDGTRKVDAKLTVSVAPTASMHAEEETVAFIEKTLRSDAFKKDGASYAKTDYDHYVLILARSNKGVATDIKDAYIARIKDVVMPTVDETTNISPIYTDAMVPALIAINGNAVIDDVDLAAPFYDKTYIEKDVYGSYTYAMITLKNLTIPAKYKTKDGVEHASTATLESMITYVLSNANENGGWYGADFMTGESVFMIDTTTNAIVALAEFYDRPTVKTAIDNAIKVLNTKQLASGALDNWGDNISTTATYISGLTALNMDPNAIKNSESSKSLNDYVDSQRIKEGDEKGGYLYAGEFNEELKGKANFYSTKDAAIALISYNRYLRSEANFFNFAK